VARRDPERARAHAQSAGRQPPAVEPEIARTDRISELEDIAARHRRVWLIYTFPQDIERRRPKLRRFIANEFREQRAFRGTFGDGDVRVCLR
jgi:hypothetical protein